ncbi:glycosyltransferase family 2 protein [Lichenicoccus roseus]|uniref:Glycosyltransferase family 2 protein n=1 Tax=Lichenicoccus roseus TaxID=2683649 RepID=A0A5R9JA28_9PROT|nr:glycosyltransferase family 2 protein [Lichenicoccus roseus]TLU74435.1 glycosyltransferase family 2 protein [Lichenicoccus roseus]
MTSVLIAGALPTASKPSVSSASSSPPTDAPSYDADIIILAMDRVEETLEAIASALAQDSVRRHVFVFDQGSMPENLERLCEAARGRTDIAVLRAERNFGVAGGRNRATALGHGRVIIALDNDAEFADSHTVADAVAHLDQHQDLAAVGFRIVVHSTGQEDLSSWGYPNALLPRAGASFETITFVGAGHAISRRAWNETGGYDDGLFFCWEEFDFCLSAIARGWRIEYAGDLVVRHKVSPDRRFNWTGTRWFYYMRNRLYIERKWRSSWLPVAPRAAGYVVKGLRNGLWLQTARALPAAWRLAQGVTPTPMPEAGRQYIARNDAAHRGSLRQRIRKELLSALPGHGMKNAGSSVS